MQRIKKWITHNFWLKVISLILAVTTWSYVTWQLKKAKEEEEQAMFSMIHYDFASKVLPVEVTIAGKARNGYEVTLSGITVSPADCLVIGPKNILDDISAAKTAPVDISGCSKDIDRRISLAPIPGGFATKDEFIKVHIPIVKIPEEPKPAQTAQ